MPKREGKAKSEPTAKAYIHEGEERVHIPEVGSIDFVSKDKDATTRYCWDPRESPQLVWAGKAGLRRVEVDEQASLDVPLVNLHIHERVAPEAILRAVQRQPIQPTLFEKPELDGSKQFQFYRHGVDWSNRMILGDSLLVMNSLVECEGMRGSVQCIYMDPPYGIKYASNFQPRIDQRDVKDGKDEDLTREVMQVQAFRDTWELGVHSYLTYLRDRLLMARELLKDEGSIFVQIGDENVHRVRCLMDEVFGEENFVSTIAFRKTSGATTADYLSSAIDHLLWFAKDKSKLKYREVYKEKKFGDFGTDEYDQLELVDGTERKMTQAEEAGLIDLPKGARAFATGSVVSDGFRTNTSEPFDHKGFTFKITRDKNWKTSIEGMRRLLEASRVYYRTGHRIYKRYLEDFPVTRLTTVWNDFRGALNKVYAVQTAANAVERCILMTTDPGDLVLDPTCGSGTTAFVAEQWGRRWITCDTSRVALAIARHRLMTAAFDYYKLRHPTSGVGGGFVYKTVPHITLKSIAQNPEIDTIASEFQPRIDEALETLNRTHRPDGQAPWKEWEVPRLTDEEWTFAQDARRAGRIGSFAEARLIAQMEFWELKRAMQAKIDASIQRNAPTEELVDQPEKEKGIVRVTGPFTMEAVPDVAEVGVNLEEKIIDELQVTIFEPVQKPLSAVNASAYVHDMIERLKKSGVNAKGNKRIEFENLRPVLSERLHAEGEIVIRNGEDKRMHCAVLFGPPNGSISEVHVRDGLAAGRKYDAILFAGYEFTEGAQTMVREANRDNWMLLMSYISPDTAMGDLLKDTKSAQLFTLIGEPDVIVYQHGDSELPQLLKLAKERDAMDVLIRAETLNPGEAFIELRGVDLYDPVSGETTTDSGQSIHAFFVDTNYDGKSFCICQAMFPNKKDSWSKIAKNLRGTIDEEAFEAFRTTVSLPFKVEASAKVQVKVIDQRGNAIVKTLRV